MACGWTRPSPSCELLGCCWGVVVRGGGACMRLIIQTHDTDQAVMVPVGGVVRAQGRRIIGLEQQRQQQRPQGRAHAVATAAGAALLLRRPHRRPRAPHHLLPLVLRGVQGRLPRLRGEAPLGHLPALLRRRRGPHRREAARLRRRVPRGGRRGRSAARGVPGHDRAHRGGLLPGGVAAGPGGGARQRALRRALHRGGRGRARAAQGPHPARIPVGQVRFLGGFRWLRGSLA